ncbi:MAG TPA: response regulator transcription factor [Steroidobacteraceae bacterium]|nr:response regulator transcription factor [Steroidobacteraceae bacterium]
MIRVLLIDDDRRHSELLEAYCARFDIQVDCAYDGESGLRRLASSRPDLVLLDVMLPGRDGFSVCREIRRRSRLPVIMLTARGDVVDRVAGLELGADDYIAKPFEPRELVARIHTVLRRLEPGAGRSLLEFDGLSIDTTSRTVIADGARIELTTMEYELLLLLASHPGQDFSRDDILAALRGIDAAILTRSVDILVSRLRARLGDSTRPARWIHTVWGRGYRFTGRTPAAP